MVPQLSVLLTLKNFLSLVRAVEEDCRVGGLGSGAGDGRGPDSG